MKTQTTSSWKKPLRFALFGALGCLAGALVGELWLALTAPAAPPAPPPPAPHPAQSVVLVLDTSDSMWLNLGEMKEAAQNFVSQQDFKKDRTAVVRFDSDAQVVAPLTQNAAQLQSALGSLSLGGSTRMDLGLQMASAQLGQATGNKSVLLFTDGLPDDANDVAPLSLQEAQSLRSHGVRIVAIGTGDADVDYLARVTGDPALVMSTSSNEYSKAFDRAQSTIYGHQLTDSAPVAATDLGSALRRIAVWTALLSSGLAFALVWGQAHYLRRPLVLGDGIATLSSVAFGFLAGVVAQLWFGALGGGTEFGRLISWGLLGALIANGMGRVIPNLNRKKSLQFGAIGGALASIGFSQMASLGSDATGRLFGAALLGGIIGLLVIFAERASRHFWLEVHGKDQKSEIHYDLNLGKEAVRLGGNREICRIYLPQSEATVGEFFVEGDQVFYQAQDLGHGQTRRENIVAGQMRSFGDLNITLRQSLKETPIPSLATPASTASSNLALAALPASQQFSTSSLVNSLPTVPPLQSTSLPLQNTSIPQIIWRLSGTNQTAELPRRNGIFTIGRLPTNNFVVNDAAVSSHHAQIEVRDGRIWFSDSGSTNGTWINEIRVQEAPVELHAGDRILMGREEWIVRCD